jgi:hypothetical protein
MGKEFIMDRSKGEQPCIPCNHCLIDTKHDVLASVSESGIEFNDEETYGWMCEYQMMQCRGCESISYRQIASSSDDPDDTFTIFPARISGRKEISRSWHLPAKVNAIYKETYKAASNNMPVLAAIGIRTLVEAVCSDKGASGYLVEKIDKLVAMGVLTKDGADILHGTRFLGNGAAHEVQGPSDSEIEAALDVAENLLQNVYILPEIARRLQKKETNP